MEELIKQLIEVDKKARKKVRSKKKERVGVVEELDKKREQLKTESQKKFDETVNNEKEKSKQIFEKETSDDGIAARTKAISDRLDAQYEQNGDKWVDMIVKNVVG